MAVLTANDLPNPLPQPIQSYSVVSLPRLLARESAIKKHLTAIPMKACLVLATYKARIPVKLSDSNIPLDQGSLVSQMLR